MGTISNSEKASKRLGRFINVQSENSKKKTLPVFQEIRLTKAGPQIAQQESGFRGYLVGCKVDEFEYEGKKKKKFVFEFIDSESNWKVDSGINAMSLGIINKLVSLAQKNDKLSNISLDFSLWEGTPNAEYTQYTSNCSIRITGQDETVKNAYSNEAIKKVAPWREFNVNGEKVYDKTDFHNYFFKMLEEIVAPKLNPSDCPITPTGIQEAPPAYEPEQHGAPVVSKQEKYTAAHDFALPPGAKAPSQAFSQPASFDGSEDDDLPF
jgi:hypothetical protein